MEHSHHNEEHDWFSYYENHQKIQISNILLHWQYLLAIVSKKPKNILEIGCGPADHSLFISSIFHNIKISLLDSDERIVKLLKKKTKNKITEVYKCDITNKKEINSLKFNKEFDVIYSQGVMEHFSSPSFKEVIKNFLPFTKRFVISIPSEKYSNQDYGDEILRTKDELDLILKDIPKIKYTIKGYFPDVGIRTKLEIIKQGNNSFYKNLNFLLLDSCHYLIKIEKLK